MKPTPLREPAAEPRLPPANIEAEQALLGTILINNTAHSQVAEFLMPEHFANEVHGRIYAAIGALIGDGTVADPITLKSRFDRDGALAEIGGSRYLARLCKSAVTLINAEHYARAVLDVARRRAIIAAGTDLVDAAYAGTDIDQALPNVMRRICTEATVSPLALTCAANLAYTEAPERPWLVPHWIPRRQVTLFSGDGGGGKSQLAMQLQAAASAGTEWLGLSVMQCRSLAFYAEDEEDELHRRLEAIINLAPGMEGALCDMHWRSVVGDAAELVELDERGEIRPSAFFRRIERAALASGARLLILDAAANFYGLDENRRTYVNTFVNMLRRLAIRIDGAVLLIAHPSVHGIASGSGLSGSTHWNNSVRSRLYLTRMTGDDADPDERELTRKKSNYASAGDVLRLRWQQGGFIALDTPSGIDRAALCAKAERVFRSLLSLTYGEGTWTSPNPSSRNYAPAVFAVRGDREGLGKSTLAAAMLRLQRAGVLKTETYGRPSEPRTRLALA